MAINSRTGVWLLALVCFWATFSYIIMGVFSLVNTGAIAHIDGNMSMQYADPSRPYWHIFGASGLDLQAMGMSFDLPRLLFQHLPMWLSYAIWHVVPLWALALTIYVLARERLNLGILAALFSAFVAIQSFEDHNAYFTSVILAPAFLWLLFRLFDNPRDWKRWLSLGVFCWVYAASAVLPIILIYPVVFLGIAILLLYRPLRLWHFIVLGASFVLVYAFRFEAIWASLANAPLSHRAHWTAENLTRHYYVSDIGEAFAAVLSGDGFFPQMGLSMPVFGLVMVLVAWAIPGGERRYLKRITGVLALGVALGFVMPLSVSLLATVIPAAKGFSADRLGWYVQLFACLGAGMAVERLVDVGRDWRHSRFVVLSPFIVGIALSLYFKAKVQPYQWITEGSYARAYESPVLNALARRIADTGTPGRALTLQIYTNTLHSYGIETVGGQYNLYPERYRRFWVKMIEPSLGIDPSFDVGARDWGGYMMLGLVYTLELKDTSSESSLASKAKLNLVSLANGRYVVSRTRLTDPQLTDLNLGQPEKPWDTLTSIEKMKINARENFTGRKNLYVYENTSVLPRFRFVEHVVTKKDEAEVIDAISDMSVDQLSRTLLIDKTAAELLGGLNDSYALGDMEIISHNADKIELEVGVDEDAMLVVANSYSKFWKCRIDGVETPIVPAYAVFWGVSVPAGAGRVEFSYEPPYAFFR